jgi:hypothetical protein
MINVAYNYESMLFAYADSTGITVNTVYYRKFLQHHLCPALHCKWPQWLWSGSAVCPWQCSVTWPIQWFVQKMELGSLRTSTTVTGYMLMWLQFLSGSERTITLHLLQDDRWWWECKEHALTDTSRTDTADGIRHLLHVWQSSCNVAGHCTYSL